MLSFFNKNLDSKHGTWFAIFIAVFPCGLFVYVVKNTIIRFFKYIVTQKV